MARRVPLLLVLVLGAGAGLLALQRAGETERVADRRAAEEEPEPPPAPPGTLEVRDGVAHAPEPPAREEAKDVPSSAHAWVGRAWSRAERRGVPDASVVLEDLESGEAWACERSGPAGFFVAPAPPLAPKSLRLVLESPKGEIGIVPVAVGEGRVTDLGRILLGGHGVLKGRVMERSRREPIAHVRVVVRRFGELIAEPGALAAATSDEMGDFELTRLPHGSFVVLGVGTDGRRYFAAPAVVPALEPLVLHPLETAALELAVRDSLDDPQPGALVEALPVAADPKREPLDPALYVEGFAATTTSDGRATLAHVPPGPYTLFVTLEDGTRFEFSHHHVEGARRVLRVPADRIVRLVFWEAPSEPPRPPLAHAKVKLTVEGETSRPERNTHGSLVVKTDAFGRAGVLRLGTLAMQIEAWARKEHRVGTATVRYRRVRDDIRVQGVRMSLEEPEPEGPKGITIGERRARVRTPAGLPVKGATVYVEGGARRRTGARGQADLGEARSDRHARLFRRDLASGDPGVLLENREEVEIVWNPGRVVEVRVSDARTGTPFTSEVRIRPRPGAWERASPGLFRSRWDAHYADPEARIVVSLPGFEDFEAAPPAAGVEPFGIDARMVPAKETTATLVLETLAGNAPRPGVWVRGHFDATWKAEGEGRTTFHALTGLRGAVEVAGLVEGPWRIRIDGGTTGWGERPFALARGMNRIAMHLDRRPTVKGVVEDDRGKPVARARIEQVLAGIVFKGHRYPRLPVPFVRTDAKGRFAINVKDGRRDFRFRAHAPGHTPADFYAKAGTGKPVRVTLARLASIDLPIRWRDGRGDPVPEDIEMRIHHYGSGKRRRSRLLDVTARVEGGRLRAEGILHGRLSLQSIRGRGRARSMLIELDPGETARAPAVQIDDGGVLEGKVTDGQATRPGVLVFAIPYVDGHARVARTDENGEFRITGLPQGSCRVAAPDQLPQSVFRNQAVRIRETSIAQVVVMVQ